MRVPRIPGGATAAIKENITHGIWQERLRTMVEVFTCVHETVRPFQTGNHVRLFDGLP